jgi:NDP-sugar pyrophosphorylase family protein
MILAAGLGTRLGNIGRDTPKALIDVAGATMLEHAARTLVAAGADRLIINVHHHADRITEFVAVTDLHAEAVVSVETDQPLETGGGLWHARSHFRRDEPFFLYNVDIITDADLVAMRRAHSTTGAIATLATGSRESTRRILFDDHGLYGRTDEARDLRIEARPPRGRSMALAFAGIHVISPELFERIEERGSFSILDPYLRLAGEDERILPWSIDGCTWIDVGTPARLLEARRVLPAR